MSEYNKVYAKEWYRKHREEILAQRKREYAKNPELFKERVHNYYRKNWEKISKKHVIYNQTHQTWYNEYHKNYQRKRRAKNKEQA